MSLGRPQDRVPRPPGRLILTTPEHLVAFGLGAGLSPKAPGTVGTLWGVALWLPFSLLSVPAYVCATVALFAFGAWITGRSAKLLGVHDDPGIVFDEIVGFLVTALPILPALHPSAHVLRWVALAFVLFRLFDVWKPWPIRRLDEAVHGGFGIMLDDLVAGLYGAAVLLALTRLA